MKKFNKYILNITMTTNNTNESIFQEDDDSSEENFDDISVSPLEMNKFYANFAKRTTDELKTLNRFLVNYEKALYQARCNNKHSEIETIRKTISKYQEKIKDKEEYLEKLTNKTINKEIKREVVYSQRRAQQSNAIQVAKFRHKQRLKAEDKKILQKFFSKEKKTNKYAKNEKWGIKSSFKYFVRNSNNIPEYMKKNLKEMPNNKGYIWKDIRFYGALPARRNEPDILFEKLRGGIMLIHEITESEHKIFEKKGRDRRRLKSVTQRVHRR
tara:strand:- start:115 stop:924 length:810 start_codon:yes stop_codon:yes gene_type:complete